MLDREGVAPVDDPLSALAGLAGEVVAVKDYAFADERARVVPLHPDELTFLQAAALPDVGGIIPHGGADRCALHLDDHLGTLAA